MEEKNWHISGALAEYSISVQDGQYFIRYCAEKIKKDAYLPLISERHPEKEAMRVVGGFQLKKGLIAVVFGAAAIKVIEILKDQQKQNGGEILVFEADPAFGDAVRKIFSDLYKDIPVFTPDDPLLNRYIDSCSIEEMMGYRFLPMARSYELGSPFYKKMEAEFKMVFSIRFSDLLTRIEFEGRWILNAFVNLIQLQKGIAVREFFNTAGDQHAIIVSTGPSLRESLAWLKQNRDRYFIACVDSAWRVLYRYGITPHLIFTLDSQAQTTKHFQGLPLGQKGEFPLLYTDLVSNPKVVQKWKGDVLFGITSHYFENHRTVTPGCDFIEENFLDQPCGDIQSGGSVATSLFDLLRNMGFSSITLLGQDLAFTNREIHCIGTHHTDQWLSKTTNRFQSLENINNGVLKKRSIHWSTSITQKPLPEDYIFSLYRKWFEEAISTVPMPVYNAGSDGAVINGVKPFQQPAQALSPKFLEKLINITAKASSNGLKKDRLGEFVESIQSSKNDDFSKWPFMERIGKKYYIKYLRIKVKEAAPDPQTLDRYLRLYEKEKKIFWNQLKKRIHLAANLQT